MSDTDVRELLERMAAEPTIAAVDAEPMVRRARRRLARNLLGGAAAVAVGIGVLIGGGALLRSSPTVPAEPPRLTPQPIPPPMHNGPITFVGFLDGVVELDIAGDHRERLVSCKALGGSCTETGTAAWSWDGTRLAYTAQCGGGCGSAGDPIHGIRILDVRTGEDTLVLPGEGFAGLAWSPDGTRIAYTTWTRFEDDRFVEDRSLHILPLDGSRPVRISGVEGPESASWSPDGTSLVVGGGAMSIVAADGSTDSSLGPGHSPAWSPDGSRIAFARFGPRCEIWTMTPDGANREVVASVDPNRQGQCGPGFSQAGVLVWSPDGRRLAYFHWPTLWLVDLGGDLVPVHIGKRHLDGAWGIAWRPVP